MTTVTLGFEVPSGHQVDIPVRHMAITGQTQEAGKTTALEALLQRSKRTSLVFVTKPGEGAFRDANPAHPYFRDAGDWQFVASVLEASRGEKLKFERAWIIRASKGAKTLAKVHENVKRLMDTAKGMSADVYLTLDAYLDVVVPTIGRIPWHHSLELDAGLNVMDLSRMPTEMQHLVIKSSLEWVLTQEQGVTVVIPEAWKFIPQGRNTPVKLAAEAFIRQGAGQGNYLWLDSQDLGGIEKTILRSVAVWLLGVQREANEIKRTLENIPPGTGKPKAGDLAQLELGQFYACWGRHVVKTYVQPAWVGEMDARSIALGQLDVGIFPPPFKPVRHPVMLEPKGSPKDAKREDDDMTPDQDKRLTVLVESMATTHRLLERLVKQMEMPPPWVGSAGGPASEEEQERLLRGYKPGPILPMPHVLTYEEIKARLIEDLQNGDAAMLELQRKVPSITVLVTRPTITVDGDTLRGRIARLMVDGFFTSRRRSLDVYKALAETSGEKPNNAQLGAEMRELVKLGFFTMDPANGWFTFVPGMVVNVVEK